MALTMTRFVSLLIVTVLFSSAAEARCEVDITDYVGWQIIYSGTVTGYLDENGQEEDSFEGCEYGRVLIVDYSKSVTCTEYNYTYAYHPDIVILSNGGSLKACIDDEMYDVRK